MYLCSCLLFLSIFIDPMVTAESSPSLSVRKALLFDDFILGILFVKSADSPTVVYLLVIFHVAIEHGPVEIVDFPIENGDFPVRKT